MKQYKIGVFFEKGYLVSSQINLVTEDYKSTEFIFEFDIEEGRKVFELKKPDGSKYIKDIINNKITLVDYDTELNEISLIPAAGTYEFEIVNYTEDSKLTLQEHGHFEVRGEIVEVNDSEVEKDTRLPILDSLINDVEGLKTDINSSVENATEQANYAKQQGDYAKKQAQIIIDANTTATKIINDFETNVSGYTKDFNTNAEEKLEVYNQNDIDKTQAYNKNAESKENSYNENASNKLKEYNDNATTKLSEYNTNSETKTTTFNTNASEKTDAFNLNATNKTTDFDSNAEAKTTEFNNNATTKTEEYNTNAEAKVNEFNTNVDELRKDVEDCYNNMLTNEVEGTSIHVEDSANARIISLESEGNCEQATTKGNQLLDTNNITEDNADYHSMFAKNILPSIECTFSQNVVANIFVYEYDNESNQILYTPVYGKKTHTFTTNENTTSVKIMYDFTKNTDKVMLNLGTEALPYEPYTGGQPSPSPDFSEEIEVVEGEMKYKLINKNLVDFSKYYDKSNLITTFDFTDDVLTFGSTVDTAYSSVKYNITDIFKKNIGRYVSFDFEDAEQTNAEAAPFIRLLTTYNNGLPDRYEVLVGNKFNNKRAVQLLSIDGAGNPVDLDNIKLVCLQFVLNVQATEMINTVTIKKPILYFGTERLLNGDVFNYVPHESNEMLVNLQGNFIGKIGDVKDTLRVDNGRAILTKRIDKIVLNGSEDWSLQTVNSYSIANFALRLTNRGAYTICDKFTHQTTLIDTTQTQGIFINSTTLYIRINSSIANTVSSFKTWLSNNSVTVYYVLTEPYEVDLGPVNMPKTFEGVTNISMISNPESNMKLKYVRSTNIVVDNLAKAIVALGGEV